MSETSSKEFRKLRNFMRMHKAAAYMREHRNLVSAVYKVRKQ